MIDADTIEEIDPFEKYGVSGLAHSYGRIEEEWLPQLSGDKAARVYREMVDNDPIIGATLYLYETLTKAADWRVESANPDDPKANEWAEFVEDCRVNMAHSWSDFLDEALTMLPYGWALMEPTYKEREDRKIGWDKIELRAQETLERWHFEEKTGDLIAFEQRDPVTNKLYVIPRSKFVLFRPKRVKNNPEGRSVLRAAYRPWYFKKNLEKLEAIGAERDLAGLPVIQVPPAMMSRDASADQKAIRALFETRVQQIRRNERDGLVIPAEKIDGKETGYKFELLQSGGKRQIDTDVIIRRFDRAIATTLLAQFLLLGSEGHGSFAMTSSMTSTMGFSMNAVLDKIAETFTQECIGELMRLNGVPVEYWPKMAHGDVESVDIKDFAETINKLVGASVLTPDQDLEDYVRDYAGLPQRAVPEVDVEDPAVVTSVAPEGGADKDLALNGIQIRSAAELIRDVMTGAMPKATVRVMLISMLKIPTADADAMLAPVSEGSMRPAPIPPAA